MVIDKEIEDTLIGHGLIPDDLTPEELEELRIEMPYMNNGSMLDGVLSNGRLFELGVKRRFQMLQNEECDKLRRLIARCKWTFAKTMPQCPHEYIVRGKCPLTEEEFLFIVDKQRNYGKPERWGTNIFPYLHIDGYKYWTMGDTYENTIIINRAKEE